MVSTIRSSLIILLVLLQTVAPLVHAHTGGDFRNIGLGVSKLHVPGLETYVSFDSGTPSCFAASTMSVEGLIVGINTGIKQQDTDIAFSLTDIYCPPVAIAPLTPPISPLIIQATPLQAALLFGRPQVSAHTPRAPPAQSRN